VLVGTRRLTVFDASFGRKTLLGRPGWTVHQLEPVHIRRGTAWGAHHGAVMGTDSVNWAYQGTTSLPGTRRTTATGIQSDHLPVKSRVILHRLGMFYTLSTGPFTETYDEISSG